MNKFIYFVAGTALALALVGCHETGSAQIDTEQAPAGSAVEVSDTVPDADTSDGTSANTDIPFTEVSSVQEAADLVGFGMDGPEDIDGYSLSTILAFTSDDPMIDMRYLKGDDEMTTPAATSAATTTSTPRPARWPAPRTTASRPPPTARTT